MFEQTASSARTDAERVTQATTARDPGALGPVPTPFMVDSPYVRRAPRPGPAVRLVCFPYAGAGASAYNAWPDLLPPWVEVLALQLPGRQDRMAEPPFTRAAPLTAVLRQVLRPYAYRTPLAFFGHSAGALLAFEVARAIAADGAAAPAHLFLSGRGAPDLPARVPPLHALSADDFRDRLRDLEGTPPEILDDGFLFAMLEPALRADFQVWETYSFQPSDPLPAPITALGGERDAQANAGELAGWDRHSGEGFELWMFAGGHFFVDTGREEVVGRIGEALGRSVLGGGGS